MNYYLKALQNYVNFSGRARRREYWYFFLINITISIILNTIGFSTIASIYSLAVLIPGIAVAIRRMHDVNKSGWYLLIPIYNLILVFTNGTQGNNSFGPDSKQFSLGN